jgi:hypothetical protein
VLLQELTQMGEEGRLFSILGPRALHSRFELSKNPLKHHVGARRTLLRQGIAKLLHVHLAEIGCIRSFRPNRLGEPTVQTTQIRSEELILYSVLATQKQKRPIVVSELQPAPGTSSQASARLPRLPARTGRIRTDSVQVM